MLSWLSLNLNIDWYSRCLTFLMLCVFSPSRWLMTQLLMPEIQLETFQDWQQLPNQLHQLSPSLLFIKVTPVLIACIAISFGYFWLCQKISRLLTRFIANHLRLSKSL